MVFYVPTSACDFDNFLFQMIQVPQRGPGCQHFLTCAVCLTAPKFMGCGWCSGVCSWESDCDHHWRNDSCPPGITGVSLPSCHKCIISCQFCHM